MPTLLLSCSEVQYRYYSPTVLVLQLGSYCTVLFDVCSIELGPAGGGRQRTEPIFLEDNFDCGHFFEQPANSCARPCFPLFPVTALARFCENCTARAPLPRFRLKSLVRPCLPRADLKAPRRRHPRPRQKTTHLQNSQHGCVRF